MLLALSAKTPTSAPAHGRGKCFQAMTCWICFRIAHRSNVALGKQQQLVSCVHAGWMTRDSTEQGCSSC